MSFEFKDLLAQLGSASSDQEKSHLILSYHTNLYQYVNSNSFNSASTQVLLSQLDSQLEFYHNDKNKDLLALVANQATLVSIAKNYTTLLSKSKIKLFEIANQFVTIYSDSKEQSSLKELSAVVLTFLYESFGREVTSFISLLLSTTFKNFKKEKANPLRLAQLLSTILRNGGVLEIDDSIVSKYHKLLKTHINDTEILSALYNSFGIVASSNKKIDLLLFQSQNHSYISSGLSHKNSKPRVLMAKALAEALAILNFNNTDIFNYYIELYIDSQNPNQQTGVVESLIHLFALKSTNEPTFINHNFVESYNLITNIFKHERFNNFTENGKQRLIEHLELIFISIIKLTDESNQKVIFDGFFSLLDKSNFGTWKSIISLRIVDEILKHFVSNLSDHDIEKYQIVLWKLIGSTIPEVRIHSVLILKSFASKFPVILKELLDTSLNELINNSKQSASDKIFNKSHGFALVLANLISLADKDYVPESLIDNVWKFGTSVITQNRELNETNYLNLTNSWIAISGVFTYYDKHHVSSLTDEFLSIWENLEILDAKKISKKSLNLANYALVSLLSFLNNVEIDSKIASFFISSLTSRRPILHTIRDQEDLKPVLDLIENRSLQVYLKLIDHVKNDNSSILIQAIHNFASLPNYVIPKNEKSVQVSPWSSDDGFNNGITSKYRSTYIDELYIKLRDTNSETEQRDFSIDSLEAPKGIIGLNKVKSWYSNSNWIEDIESTIKIPVSSALTHDPFLPLLVPGYSLSRKFAPPVKTSIVDSSIEIFSKCFSSLSTKVQLSLLETLRSHLLSKSNDPNTTIAVTFNTSISIHGALTIAFQEGHVFENSVGTVLLETLNQLHKFLPDDKLLLSLNAESIGILISKTTLIEQIPIFIKKLVDEEDSNSRAFNISVLGYVYQYNASHFSQILEVFLQFLTDIHPLVHSWTLDALSTIIEKHVVINQEKAVQILEILERCYLSNDYGKFSSSSLVELNYGLDSNLLIAKVLRDLNNSLGPGIKDLPSSSKQILKDIAFGSFFNFNEQANSKIQLEILKLFQELNVFDPSFIEKDRIIQILKFIIQANIGTFIGSSTTIPLYEDQNEFFITTSSYKVTKVAWDFLSQLVKTSDDKSFLHDLEYLIWISLESSPESKVIKNLVKEWIDSTYDISWLTKLEKLFNTSRSYLYKPLVKHYADIANKYVHKKIEVDVKDEEAQAITNKTNGSTGEEDDDNRGEGVNWRFKVAILNYLKQLLSYTSRDSKLYQDISRKVSSLIKISYSSSTSSVIELRLLGIELLGEIITTYSTAEDPIYPKMSLLKQQQAQITSALIPAFSIDSTPIVASYAIQVAATFIGSSIVDVSKLSRITKILIQSLEDLSHGESGDEYKINDVIITSEIGQRRVKLAVLNAWAELKILAKDNQELVSLVDEHSEILLPLWISTLKEFALLKHDNTRFSHDGDDLFEQSWVNFVEVIGCISRDNLTLITNLLNDDAIGFYYLIYSHSIFALLGNNSTEEKKSKIISALTKIVVFKPLVELIIHRDTFHESIEVIERLVLTGTEEQKLLLIDLTSAIFWNSFDSKAENFEGLSSSIDSLFELFRINLQPIVETIPLKSDVVVKSLTESQLRLLKKSFGSITKMVLKFPDIIKSDLYSSILSVIKDIYTKAPILVPQLIGVIKEILTGLSEMGDLTTINNFYQSVKPLITSHSINTLLTLTVFLTSTQDFLKLNEEDLTFIAQTLLRGLSDQSTVPIVTQTIKSLVFKPHHSTQQKILFKKLVPDLVLKSIENPQDPRLYVEIVFLIIKGNPSIPSYTILIPTLLHIYSENQEITSEYVHKRLISLVSSNPEHFKIVVNEVLDNKQRELTESILTRFKQQEATILENEHIKLKTFI